MGVVKEQSSFRDPSGHVFYKDNKVFRQVNKIYKDNFDFFHKCGLYENLVKNQLILPFKKNGKTPSKDKNAYMTISTIKIPFISYPFEWSFSMLKDAALTTIKIARTALFHNMILKDASAYNIQFFRGKPILIDYLSFEKYRQGSPWVAYRQFCQHFLAPLALCAKVDPQLNNMTKIYIDGIPLSLAGNLLPSFTWLNFGLATHIHIHGKSQKRYSQIQPRKKTNAVLSLNSLLGILNSLESAVKSLNLRQNSSHWSDYYNSTNYTSSAFSQKKENIRQMIAKLEPKTVWDLGANTGEFSRIAAHLAQSVISFDIDPNCVEKNYLEVKKNKEEKILPLIMDFSNPSSGIGWESMERKSLIDRGPADCLLALALVHHLAIANNVPFAQIAGFFARVSKSAIVEFVPKTDSQVQRMLFHREDIFTTYDKANFESSFSKYFKIISCQKIKGSQRILYCLVRR